MGRVENIQQLTRDAIAQTMGVNYYPATGTGDNKNLAEIDTYKLPDVGRDIDEADKNDVFTKSLVVRIGKVVTERRLVPYIDPAILKDTFEYGGAIESIRLGLYEVQDDPSWELTNGKSYADYDYTFHQPETSVRLFDDRKAIMITKSMTRRQLKEAFTSWDAMSSFIDGISVAWENTMRITINTWTRMLMASAIAISDKATSTAVHFLTEAKARGILAQNATADDFKKSDDAMKYAFERIRNIRKYMSQDMTVAFNDKTIPCVTPVEENKLTLLSDFASIIKTIKADTFNDDELGFGEFTEITAWQGVASSADSETAFYNWDDISSVKIKADANNKLGIGTEAYSKSNVVGLMWDYLALGVSPNENYVTSNYAAGADFWNDHAHYTANYWVDSRYNMVAFILD